jgi:copper(I)-binding protein
MTPTSELPHSNRLRRLAVASLAAALIFGGAACGSDDEATVASDNTTQTTVEAAQSQDGAITVQDAWARPSAMMQSAGAIYMEITGGTETDELVAASVPASIAARTELHETSSAGQPGDMGDMDADDMGDMGADDMGDMGDMDADDMGDMGGMMQMKQVSQITIPAGQTVTLEPGGLHIMVLDLTEQLTDGQTFDVTLEFASGTTLVVPVTVRS